MVKGWIQTVQMFVQNDSARTGSLTRQLGRQSPLTERKLRARWCSSSPELWEAGFEILLLCFDVTLFPPTEMKQLNWAHNWSVFNSYGHSSKLCDKDNKTHKSVIRLINHMESRRWTGTEWNVWSEINCGLRQVCIRNSLCETVSTNETYDHIPWHQLWGSKEGTLQAFPMGLTPSVLGRGVHENNTTGYQIWG